MTRGLSEEARDLLTSEPLVAHLATCDDGDPHVAPLWYAVNGDAIEVTTTGRKLENLRHNPRVALSVQRAEGGDPQWGLTVQGTATVLDEAETAAVRRRINRRYGVGEDAWAENTGVRIDVGSVAINRQ
jgi:PPOX class probable F420-dependent enzyme